MSKRVQLQLKSLANNTNIKTQYIGLYLGINMDFCLGINMLLPFKKVFPLTLD
jgi:hypothetical protein